MSQQSAKKAFGWCYFKLPDAVYDPIDKFRQSFVDKKSPYLKHLRKANGQKVSKVSDLLPLHSTVLSKISEDMENDLIDILSKQSAFRLKVHKVFFSPVERLKDKNIFCLGLELVPINDSLKKLRSDVSKVSESLIPYEYESVHISILYFELDADYRDSLQSSILEIFNSSLQDVLNNELDIDKLMFVCSDRQRIIDLSKSV